MFNAISVRIDDDDNKNNNNNSSPESQACVRHLSRLWTTAMQEMMSKRPALQQVLIGFLLVFFSTRLAFRKNLKFSASEPAIIKQNILKSSVRSGRSLGPHSKLRYEKLGQKYGKADPVDLGKLYWNSIGEIEDCHQISGNRHKNYVSIASPSRDIE